MWQKKLKSDTREKWEFVSHVPLLDEKEIDHMVLENKKHDELLSNHTGEYLMEDQVESKEMLNI